MPDVSNAAGHGGGDHGHQGRAGGQYNGLILGHGEVVAENKVVHRNKDNAAAESEKTCHKAGRNAGNAEDGHDGGQSR